MPGGLAVGADVLLMGADLLDHADDLRDLFEGLGLLDHKRELFADRRRKLVLVTM